MPSVRRDGVLDWQPERQGERLCEKVSELALTGAAPISKGGRNGNA